MMVLLMSDVVPLLFLLLSSSDRSLALYGMVFSRAFSLLFHTFAETMPFLINLDCIGIACMAFASLDACEAVGCAGLSSYSFVLLSVFCVTCAADGVLFSFMICFGASQRRGRSSLWLWPVLASIPPLSRCALGTRTPRFCAVLLLHFHSATS